MSSTDKLTKLAERFARKLSLGQMGGEAPQPLLTGSAQAGDIEGALKAAGLWEKAPEVAPLLNAAGVADDASVAVSIIVDNKMDVKYHVDTSPPAAALKLASLLKSKYGAAMKAALVAAKLTVADTVTVSWLHF
jgi:ribosomal protein L11